MGLALSVVPGLSMEKCRTKLVGGIVIIRHGVVDAIMVTCDTTDSIQKLSQLVAQTAWGRMR